MPDGLPRIDPDTIANRIGTLLMERRPGAVKPLLAALAKLAPGHDHLAMLRAAYWCQMQDIPQALGVLDAAIAGQPDNAALWLRQAEILFGEGRFEAAAQMAAQAVLLAPGLHAAKSCLGLALLQLGMFDQALLCLKESFAGRPNVEVALALAALSPETAIETLDRAVAAMPRLAVLRNALIRHYLASGDTAPAQLHARQAVGDGIADAQTHCLLAFAEMEAQDWDAAMRSAARAQSIAPGDSWSARLLGALSGRASGRLGPDAAGAGQASVSGGGIAPGCFRQLLEQSNLDGPVLDLFCGNGLNAIAALDLAIGPWTGIDPSTANIERCAEIGLYATVEQTDPLQALATGTKYPVILLNEALGYWAAPQALLGGVHVCLAPGGMAVAAVPTGRSGLGGSGMFAHPEPALAQAANDVGLSCQISRAGILRHLDGLPVHGVIASFRVM